MFGLFTFIVEHEGASSVSQVLARDVVDSFQLWTTELPIHLVDILTKDDIVSLQRNLANEEPILLTGRTNVWFVCGYSATGFARINIVQTELLSKDSRETSDQTFRKD